MKLLFKGTIFLAVAIMVSLDARVYTPPVAERIVRNAIQEKARTGTIKNVAEFKAAFQDLTPASKNNYEEDYNDILEAVQKQSSQSISKKGQQEKKQEEKEKLTKYNTYLEKELEQKRLKERKEKEQLDKENLERELKERERIKNLPKKEQEKELEDLEKNKQYLEFLEQSTNELQQQEKERLEKEQQLSEKQKLEKEREEKKQQEEEKIKKEQQEKEKQQKEEKPVQISGQEDWLGRAQQGLKEVKSGRGIIVYNKSNQKVKIGLYTDFGYNEGTLSQAKDNIGPKFYSFGSLESNAFTVIDLPQTKQPSLVIIPDTMEFLPSYNVSDVNLLKKMGSVFGNLDKYRESKGSEYINYSTSLEKISGDVGQLSDNFKDQLIKAGLMEKPLSWTVKIENKRQVQAIPAFICSVDKDGAIKNQEAYKISKNGPQAINLEELSKSGQDVYIVFATSQPQKKVIKDYGQAAVNVTKLKKEKQADKSMPLNFILSSKSIDEKHKKIIQVSFDEGKSWEDLVVY